MAHPYLFTTPADASLFQLPPPADPMPIPPPSHNVPFTIPDAWFTAALDPKVPLTIAAVYAVTAKALNAYNKSTNKRPWAISKTRAFRAFVVAHNIFLAVYSAWTWYGTLHVLRRSIVSPTGPNGWAGTMDSFCKFHGTAGLGNDISYNQATGIWESATGTSLLDANGVPSRDVSGRLWNEGLAFYGWIFYLSKFYEVLDTLIILAKGKFSSTLQTYHHAGAMMAMWAGIRYMSAPIWMFVFFNSFVHSLMYTYYTVTAFNVKVPQVIKRSLTTLQISQFVIGVFWATAHSFISYTAPVQVPVAKPAASPAAGTSGTAVEYETQWRDTACVTGAGSTFAIWVNVIYLLPLTYLFVSFFIASYVRRSNRAAVQKKADQDVSSRSKSTVEIAERAGRDAARNLEREVYRESGSPALTDSDSDANKKGASTKKAPKAKASKKI
ncbi:GNS1/SUR4 family-domain-containing protein [Microdochium trichocladiopsis]|uniref:Elongation of fatty acids protein n=1 Tax=Microdochium trichocladiopsis TaxID=1682393 RepID=A0A9P8YEZ5_9PEZI|nr:GNS1/SUR4 family-domain-containing protein [Microdochium trichocladiopsis]KAH7037667.1 GNS1/SUR4 family-domain-containing protein [Microdochium trichocladiopsis]